MGVYTRGVLLLAGHLRELTSVRPRFGSISSVSIIFHRNAYSLELLQAILRSFVNDILTLRFPFNTTYDVTL